MDSDFHKIMNEDGIVINKDKEICVGDNVWLGCRSTVLKGAVIPSGSIIAACSVISGILEKDNCIFTSNHKIIKENVKWII